MKKYLTIAKAEWLDALQNPGEVFIYIVLESIPVFIMGSLWIANKNNLSNLDVSPSQLVTYYFIVLMTSRVIDFYFDETAQVEIRDGTFSKHLLKPFSFPLYLISSNLGGKMFHFFSLYIPVLFLLAFTFKSQIILPSSYNTLFFVISLVLAYFINFAISALTATAAFFWEQSLSLIHANWMLISTAGGYMLPLYLYPNWLQSIFNFLPFKYLYYIPAAIFTNKLNLLEASSSLIYSLIWAVALNIIAYFFWKSGLKRYTSVGA
ncbi:MAG: ABC-2 family transporter protein [Patescibacteria group bacterium]